MEILKKNKQFLEGKVAIITGGSRGIGKETTELFLKKGCRVVIVARTEAELENTTQEFNEYFHNLLPIKADVSKEADQNKIIDYTIKEFKKINILINNAAVCPYKDLEKTDHKTINDTIDINIKGLISLTKLALPYIKKQNFGRIINISSGLGKVGMAGFSVYSATKHAVIGFTKSLALELGQNNSRIKVVTVCPKGTATKMYFNNFPKTKNIFLDSPKKVAKIILKTCDPDKDIKNGEIIDV